MEELFECLMFYADKENYSDIESEIDEGELSYFTTRINKDYGLKARNILLRLIKDTCKKEGIDFKVINKNTKNPS